jgi:GAF domain-containing protein
VVVPLSRNGALISCLFVNDCVARVWSADDVLLIEDVAGRIWSAIERVRAEAALRQAAAGGARPPLLRRAAGAGAARARRPQAAGAGAGQPDQQRRQVHA